MNVNDPFFKMVICGFSGLMIAWLIHIFLIKNLNLLKESMMNTHLIAIKNKFSRLSRKKAVYLTVVIVLLVLFPCQALLLANGLLEAAGAIAFLFYAAKFGLLDGESSKRKRNYFSTSGYGDDGHSDAAEKYQNEVDLGFH